MVRVPSIIVVVTVAVGVLVLASAGLGLAGRQVGPMELGLFRVVGIIGGVLIARSVRRHASN